jgi:hypothetical protein
MTDRTPTPADIDMTRPNVARIYDYLLGGKDNFAADRAAAQLLIEATPDMAGVVRDNRAFLRRVVRYLAAEAGLRQFLDLGTGLPTQASVHEMAREVAPDARVVYVDNDPMVWTHGQALLADGDRVAMVLADLRDPAEVLGHPEVLAVLDLSQPVALLGTSVLHLLSDAEEPHRIVAGYRDRLAAGSYLAVTHGPVVAADEDPTGIVRSVTSVFRQASAQLHVRPVAEIRRFFDGFELVEPGVTWINEWRPDRDAAPQGPRHSLCGGVGRKP